MRRFSLLVAIALAATAASAAPPTKSAHLNCNNPSNFPNTDLVGYDFAVQVNPTANGGGASKPTAGLVLTLPASSNIIQLTKLVASGRHTSSCLLSSGSLALNLQDVNFIKLEVVGVTNPTSGTTTSVVQLTLDFDAETTLQTL